MLKSDKSDKEWEPSLERKLRHRKATLALRVIRRGTVWLSIIQILQSLEVIIDSNGYSGL